MEIDELNDLIDRLAQVPGTDKFHRKSGASKQIWIDHPVALSRAGWGNRTAEQRAEATARRLAKLESDPTGHKNLRERTLHNWNTPEAAQKRNEAVKKALSAPEWKEGQSKRSTEMWKNEAHRQQRLDNKARKKIAHLVSLDEVHLKAIADPVRKGGHLNIQGTARKHGLNPHFLTQWMILKGIDWRKL